MCNKMMKKRIIHYVTFIGIILFIILASMNSFYIPIILLLMGINLFNHSLTNYKGIKVIILTILALLPVLLYFMLKNMNWSSY